MTFRLLTLAAGALALSMGAASAQDSGGDTLDMTDWDKDATGTLTADEFAAGHELERTPRDDYFRDAETLTREDFVEGEFERFDLDDDGVIDDVEFSLWRLAQ